MRLTLPARCVALATITLVLPLICCTPAAALEPSRAPGEYNFHEWTAPEGLPYPSIRALGQDREGYLWVGSRLGAARFDGVRVTPPPADCPLAPGAGVSAFALAPDGTFWVASDRGLLRCRDGTWTQIDPSVQEIINALLCEPDGTLWVADRQRLYRIRGDKLEEFVVPGVAFDGIRGLARCTNGDIVACGARTLIIRGESAQVLGEADGMRHARSTAVAADRLGGVWIGTARGLHYYKDGMLRAYTISDGLPIDAIRSLLVDQDDNVWIGSPSGLTRWAKNKFETLEVRGDERVSHVLCQLEDREGNVWFGTDAGFAQLSDVAFSHFTRRSGLLADSAVALLHGRHGRTWLSTWGGGVTGISERDRIALRPGRELLDDVVMSLAEDAQGGLWLGYSFRGISYYRDGMVRHFPQQQQEEFDTWTFAIDKDGTVWAANQGRGVARFNGKLFEPVPVPELQRPRVVAIDARGIVWVAGVNGASYRSEQGWHFLPRTIPDAVARDNSPRSVIADPDTGVWVVFGHGEIDRYTELGAKHLALNENEVGPGSYGGERVGDELWLNERYGLVRVPIAELNAVLEGRKAAPEYVLFNEASGMRSPAPNLSGFPSVSVDEQGRIWSTTSRGFAIIDPKRIPFNPLAPNVVLESVVADKVPWSLTALQEIPPGRGELAFRFTGLSLTESSHVQFKFRLLGFEKEWSEPTHQREAHYGGLPPGRYRFEVLAANKDGVWSSQAAGVDLRILPFLHQRIEFQLLALAVLVGCVVGIIRWRVHRVHQRALELQQQNTQLEKRVADRTKELEQSYEQLRASQRELFEASRLAGIAEMATGVLHHIGNGLNSVKISAGVAANAVQQMRPAGIGKAVALLREQGEGVGEFLLRDERGRCIPEYFEQAAAVLDQQRSEVIEELASLEQAIEKVAEILAAQQNLAQTTGVDEAVALPELVDAAIRLTELMQSRCHVRITRNFIGSPTAQVDRHKALQLLVCLLRNALIAEQGVDPAAREISIDLRKGEGDRAAISVAHRGGGIAPAEIAGIFRFGYVKDAGQYGYGLHTSALAATEMRGKLVLQSDGPGCGARFILELPALTP